MRDCLSYTPLIKHVVKSLRISPENYSDMIQEAFVKLISLLAENKVDDSPYIYCSIKNHLIKILKKENKTSLNELLFEVLDDSQISAIDRVAKSQRINELKNFLTKRQIQILNELLSPSKKFQNFVRKERVLNHLQTGKIGGSSDYSVLAQYLNVNYAQIHSDFKKIEKVCFEKFN